jgi:hypothetical protein
MPELEAGDRYRLIAAVALYEVEPTLRDIYVEGRTDASFYSWFLAESGAEAKVYPIDDRICILADEVKAVDQKISARGRVIAFSIYCDRRLGAHQNSVTAIVDSDSARAVGPMPIRADCLLTTDGSSLESYVLAPRPMTKLLKVGLGIEIDSSAVIDAIVPALQKIQSVRIVLEGSDIGVVEDVAATCSFEDAQGSVDVRELIRRSLGGVSKRDWPSGIDELVNWATDCEAMVIQAGLRGRGHDIPALICGYLRERGHSPNKSTAESVLLTCLELSDIADQPLFVSLLDRVRAA